MKILVVYPQEFWTTATYCVKALKKKYEVEVFDLKKTRGYIWNLAQFGIILPGGKQTSILNVLQSLEKPDLILEIDGYGLYHLKDYKKLNIPVAYWAIDSHIPAKRNFQKKIAEDFNYIFVAQKRYVDEFKKINRNSFWLPLACDPEIHRQYPVEKKFDIGFVGSLNKSLHPERVKLLNYLAKKYNVIARSNVYMEEMAKIYSYAKIGFNRSLAGDLNMRVFEIMSCGTMLLTDNIGNGIEELFEDRKHLVLYNNLGDLDEKVRHYLENEEEREAIAGAGRKEVLDRHTYEHRMDYLIKTIFPSDCAQTILDFI